MPTSTTETMHAYILQGGDQKAEKKKETKAEWQIRCLLFHSFLLKIYMDNRF